MSTIPVEFNRGPQLNISSTSEIIVNGAKVISLNGGIIRAISVWGPATGESNWEPVAIEWSINAIYTDIKNVTPQGIYRKGSGNGVDIINVGDIISFKGVFNLIGPAFGVKADRIHDWSYDDIVKSPKTFQGVFKGVRGEMGSTTIALMVKNIEYLVDITENTSILNFLWLKTSLANFKMNDTIRVYGTLNIENQNKINAAVVRNTSIRF